MAFADEYDVPPDWTVRVERRIHGEAVLPWLTLLTLGIVPTFVDEEHGLSFCFEAPDDDARGALHVEVAYSGRTTLGWIALLDGPVPGRSVFPFTSTGSERFRSRLSLAILEHASSLLSARRTETRARAAMSGWR